MNPNDTSPSPNMPPMETLSQAGVNPMQPAVPPTPLAPTLASPNPRFSRKLIAILGVLILLIGIAIPALLAIFRNTPGLGGQANLVWWGLWDEQSSIQPLIDEYTKAHPNVTIEYIKQSPQDYRERLTSQLASGRGPDIFRIHSSWVPMFRSVLAQVPSSTIAPSDFVQTFYTTVSRDLVVGSQPLALPLQFDSIALFVNEEIFDTYLKSPPTTWDELRDLAKQLTIKDETGAIIQSGVALGTTQNVDYWPEVLALLMIQNQVDLTNPSSGQAAVAVDYFTRFSREDGVWDETLPASTAMFAQGKLAMYFGTSQGAVEIKKLNPNLRFRVVEVPQLPKSSIDEPDIFYASYWAEGVNEDSKSKTVAFDFLKFMLQKENVEQFYKAAVVKTYPRTDMQNAVASDPISGAFVTQGKEAKSWYLHSQTFDGPTGINSQLVKYFEEAVDTVAAGGSPQTAVVTAAKGVQQVLAQYGIIKAPVATPK